MSTPEFPAFKAPDVGGGRLTDDDLAEVRAYLTQNPVPSSLTQLPGFAHLVKAAPVIDDVETVSSTSFTDLSTTGPQLTDVPNGQYLLLFGAYAASDAAGTDVWMGIAANTTTPDENDSVRTENTRKTSIAKATTATLSAGNNSLTAKYKANTGAVGSFGGRWLIAIRFGN